MSVELTSTKARVRDPQKVREILATYDVKGVEIQLREEGAGWVLEMGSHIVAWDEGEWPQALHFDDWPDEDPYPDEDEGDEVELGETEWDKRFMEKGDEGFLALLRDLIPCLETPLLILVTVRDAVFHSIYSQAWNVQPGAREVQTLEVSL